MSAYSRIRVTRARANPNPYYYDGSGGLLYSGDTETLASFGARNNLPCGGHWIVGDSFAFCIEFAADCYRSPFAQVREFGEGKTEKWRDMRQHLCEIERNWHTLKSRDEVASDLGLMPNI